MLGRRGVLAGALGVAALSACDVDDLRPPEDDSTPVPSPAPGSTATPEPDADVTLAEDAAHEISAALALVDRTRRSFPRLRGRLKPVARMHRAHLRVLEPSPDRAVAAPPPAASPEEALAELAAAEDALRAWLAAAAVEARSGALARLLASVSASVAQHAALHLRGPASEGSAP